MRDIAVNLLNIRATPKGGGERVAKELPSEMREVAGRVRGERRSAETLARKAYVHEQAARGDEESEA